MKFRPLIASPLFYFLSFESGDEKEQHPLHTATDKNAIMQNDLLLSAYNDDTK